MNFKISDEIINMYNDLTIGITTFNIKINDSLKSRIKEYNNNNINELLTKEQILVNSPQLKKWEEIFVNMHAKKGHESSVVFLSRYLFENKRLFSIHPIVDLYNIISIKYGLPMGCYDKNLICDFIELRTAKKGEEFIGINSKQIEKTSGNEVVYSDLKGVFCRYWNDKDSDRTKITNETKEYILIFDGINDVDLIQQAFEEFKNIIAINEDLRLNILDKEHREINF